MAGQKRFSKISRRRVLRGILHGGVVSVGLPLLDCLLNDSGTALASNRPIPTRFATWFWGLGMNANVFIPKSTGTGFDLPEEIASLAGVRRHINLLTNFDALRDSAPNLCHYTGWIITRTGSAPVSADDRPGETIDVTVSRVIGRTTRFGSLTAAANANLYSSLSYEDRESMNIADTSPLALYAKLFGAGYQDPNSGTFTPSPQILVRKSVLSGVMEQTKQLMNSVGAEDRIRLDQYFTDLRRLENELEQESTAQGPIATCHKVIAPNSDPPPGTEASIVALRHRIFTDLFVMAVACDQTRVLNMAYSAPFATTVKPGYDKPHHACTHEEPVDGSLGYQPTSSWFLRRSMESWAYFVQAFANVREGAGSLLDNMLIYATTDTALARIHSLNGLPAFTAGKAGGRISTGLHIDGKGSPISRIGYTAMRACGVPIDAWGTKSNRTANQVTELLGPVSAG